jgi:flagellar biogenesis protein FliO
MSPFKARRLAGILLLACAGSSAALAQDAASAPSPAASGAAAIPFKREPVTTGETAYRTFAALVVVLAVGGLAIYVLRARGKGGASLLMPATGKLQVLESRRIGPKGMLVVVRWNAEELLLSHGEGGTTLIARTPAAGSDAGERT